MDYEPENYFIEMNDFLQVERPYEALDNTCYFQSVLFILAQSKRFTISYLMKENSPYPSDSLNNQLIEMMLNQRKIMFEATEYEALVEVLAEEHPDQYDDTTTFGDSSESFYHVAQLLL